MDLRDKGELGLFEETPPGYGDTQPLPPLFDLIPLLFQPEHVGAPHVSSDASFYPPESTLPSSTGGLTWAVRRAEARSTAWDEAVADMTPPFPYSDPRVTSPSPLVRPSSTLLCVTRLLSVPSATLALTHVPFSLPEGQEEQVGQRVGGRLQRRQEEDPSRSTEWQRCRVSQTVGDATPGHRRRPRAASRDGS
jgi:hypothetical protein